MRSLTYLIATLTLAFALQSCKKQESAENSTSSETSVVAENNTMSYKSAENLDSLTAILIRCLKTKNKDLYLSYCFTSEQEGKLANLIRDEKKKKYFQREFGFSLHEEVVYFENIVKYIEKTGIDLDKIEYSIIESINYNKSNYEPIELKEVIIPVIQEGLERDIVYVGVQIDSKWYFTSELSL